MTDSRRRLVGRVAEIAAEGTDPELLLDVLGWIVRPRRTPDALRRACRDGDAVAAPPAVQLRRIVDAAPSHLLRAVDEVVGPWRRLGVRVALVGDPAYPSRLAGGWPHTDGPTLLGCRGRAPDERPAVALVGTRRATGYGLAVTAWLAESVAAAGVRVVSGGAVGVDAAAHRAALALSGGTTVVLGCGHDVAYPREHAVAGGLFERVVDEGGCLVGELLPQQPPRPAHVRARNRIVAGLVDVVVVVEGGARSGALLTASAAAERGVTVLGVPGDVRAPGSVAPHRLLADGAAPCTGPADLLEALRASVPAAAASTAAPGTVAGPDPGSAADGAGRPTTLPQEVHRVLAAAWPRPVRIDDLATDTGHPAARLLAAVTRARLAGEVAEGPDGIRLRARPDG